MRGIKAAFYLSLLAGAGLCPAGELVCLKSGFCFQARSHAVTDGQMALQVGTGSVELAAGDVLSIEQVKEPVPPLQTPGQNSSGDAAAAALGRVETENTVRKAAQAQGLDADFVRSVAQAESGMKNAAVSRKGALGIMQLMPGTAKQLAVNPLDPAQNALGGARYLRELLLKYDSNSALALAAYNAGPAAVERYHGIPPYAETRQYVRRVTREYDRLHAASVAARKLPTRQAKVATRSSDTVDSAQATARGARQKRNSADLAAPGESVVREYLKSSSATD